MKEALIILGDQLFPLKFYQPHKEKLIFMAEDVGLCTHYKYHKHKITFFLTSMRTFADDLKEHDFKVHYEKLSDTTFLKHLEKFLTKNKITSVTIGEIQDKFFEKSLTDFFKTHKIHLHILETPMFLCSRQDFKNYLFYHPKPFMKTFYEGERKRLKILLDTKGKPEGGHWSYDVENRKKAPKVLTNKDLVKHAPSIHLKDVSNIVNERFPKHPGSAENFWLPTDRKGALKSLRHFLNHHISDFGNYQDAITPRAPFLYHSVISPALNMGLITPEEVIHEVLKAKESDSDIPLASVEGFIRQVMGWREFVRGIYQNYSEIEESKNFFNHQGKLTQHWYEGTTGLPPVDDAIKKASEFGYCHHIERLMILSNVMLLGEVHPHEVHKWFMEMFVDSADWVMGPNVYGMGQFSDGGLFATKPYISGSNYILKMSDYKKGEWCDVWDGLFWRFIGKNEAFFAKNPRMNMMVVSLKKMDPTKKKKLLALAEDFIQTNTVFKKLSDL
jgi:deoxyribodipyrimidine photolyase-related protein